MARMRREAAEQKAALTMEINRARQFAGEALEHVPVAFCTMDRDYRITYMNAAALQLRRAFRQTAHGRASMGTLS